MIAFLPRFYPDELVYSFIARYHVMSGHAYASITNNEIPMCMIAKYFKIPFADLFKQVNKKENDKQIFENKILELRNNNMTFKEIANKLNSNCTTVRRTYYNLKS